MVLERRSQERARKTAMEEEKEKKIGRGRRAVEGRQKAEHKELGHAAYTRARKKEGEMGADVWSG